MWIGSSFDWMAMGSLVVSRVLNLMLARTDSASTWMLLMQNSLRTTRLLVIDGYLSMVSMPLSIDTSFSRYLVTGAFSLELSWLMMPTAVL